MRMDLRKIASRVAGSTLKLMKDMGYDKMLQAAQEAEAIYGTEPVTKAMVRAFEKAFPGLSKAIPSWALQSTNATMHECEHLLFDPKFDLEGQTPSTNAVEGAIDEALTAGLSGYTTHLNDGAYQPSAEAFERPNQTVGDLLQELSSAPISTPTKKKIRDVAVRPLLQKYESKKSEPADDYRFQIVSEFLDSVLARFSSWKDIVTADREEGWRKFALQLKVELAKLSRSKI